MEKELDPEIIKATQNSLGKYVKRPPLSEKLLKKPPFRFLHDVVTSILKTTGFFEGLFDEAELVSDNVKDRESKISFLNKVVTVVGLTTGKSLSAKPSKIVAGQEADKTNELLQCLALALDKKLSSHDAVRKFKTGSIISEKPTKDTVKTVKKVGDDKKLTSKSILKVTSEKKDTNEKPISKSEKITTNTSKTKINKTDKKETTNIKKESPPKQPVKLLKPDVKKKSTEKSSKENVLTASESQNDVANDSILKTEQSNAEEGSDQIQQDSLQINTHQHKEEILLGNSEDSNPQILNTSYVVVSDNDFNSSSSRDLLETYHEKPELEIDDVHNEKNNEFLDQNTSPNSSLKHLQEESQINSNKTAASAQKLSKERESISKKLTKDGMNKNFDESQTPHTPDKTSGATRPPSVRPSSSRPGAPRLRDKHDYVVAGNENLIVGKVKIIPENTSIDEEEDTSIIIVDPKVEESREESMQISSNQHGHLVQQILDSTKEYSQTAGKTEIEWQFDALKAREASSQEIEQVKFNIQALSRVANPLGKLLDHIQEDVEVMRQELQQWTKTYEDASKELMKQKTANEESLYPLHIKIKQLNADIEEKHYKINDLRVTIYKNASRIDKLLASGNVQ